MKFEIINSTTIRIICVLQVDDQLKNFYSEKAFGCNFRFPNRRCFGSAEKINSKAFSFGDFMPKEIPLTQGQVAIIDDVDYERVSQYKWCAQKIVHKSKTVYYAKRAYLDLNGKHTTIHLHRFILNPLQIFDVDHKNGNTLDNRRCNLRIATRTQNRMNTCVRNSNKYKGVFKNTKGNKYFFLIAKDGIRYREGKFASAEDAARAYDAKAKELFGEFAWLNFPK